MGPWTRGHNAIWFVTKFTDNWRLPNSDDGYRSFLKIPVCLPVSWGHHFKHAKGPDRHHKQASLPTTLITDKGTALLKDENYCIIAEKTQIFGNTLKCATTIHPRTIDKLARTHASLKTNFNMASGEYRRQWHKYLPLAVLNYNTPTIPVLAVSRAKSFMDEFPTRSYIINLEIIQIKISGPQRILQKNTTANANSHW